MNNITLDNYTLNKIASQIERDLGGNLRFEPNTEQQFADHKARGLEVWKEQQTPHHPFTVQVQGMKKTVKMKGEHNPSTYKRVMGGVWAKVFATYPPEKFSHQLIINNHNYSTEVKLIVMPVMSELDKNHETKVVLGYRDFDTVDREFNTIQNCESFKFSPHEIAGLSMDESRNEEQEYTLTESEEEGLMCDMEIALIPEETDGFLRQLVEARDDLKSEIEAAAPAW